MANPPPHKPVPRFKHMTWSGFAQHRVVRGAFLNWLEQRKDDRPGFVPAHDPSDDFSGFPIVRVESWRGEPIIIFDSHDLSAEEERALPEGRWPAPNPVRRRLLSMSPGWRRRERQLFVRSWWFCEHYFGRLSFRKIADSSSARDWYREREAKRKLTRPAWVAETVAERKKRIKLMTPVIAGGVREVEQIVGWPERRRAAR